MVTFLLTDVEGSTRLWEQVPEEMADALAAHDALMDGAVAVQGGRLIKARGEGDSTFSVFDDPAGAVAAAIDAQRKLGDGLLRVRMAVHTGAAVERDGDYFGPTVNRCARIRGTAHGGQVVVSNAARNAIGERLPANAKLLDLGLHRLRDLAEPERIYQLCHPDLASDFPPLMSLDNRRHNLPAPLTRFVGRADELAAIEDALGGSRLVTLVGPGGAGKTRLALEAAGRWVGDHPDGVWLTQLSGLTQPNQVLPALAASLGLREEPGRSLAETVEAHLAERDVLIVLDNCEHLLDAVTRVTADVLRAAPRAHVLATSREALSLAGEQVVPVVGMSVPAEAPFETSEAVVLFIERAKQHDPAFSMNAVDRSALVEVCRRLDGLPLAIELAAALADRMSVSEIANRIFERFDLLTEGDRSAEPRQRSLTAAIDWSHDLLEPAQREAFAALSVFPGGFDLPAAEALIGAAAAPAVGGLVHKSLVVHREYRYSMLESIRLYAADRLAESGDGDRVVDRAIDWALSVVGDGDVDTLEREHDNLVALLDAATRRRPGDALRLANGLGQFWDNRGYWTEGRRLLTDVLRAPGDATDAERAAALHRAGRLAVAQGDYDDGEALLTRSLEMAERLEDSEVVLLALGDLGSVRHRRGDTDGARARFEAALTIARAANDERSIAASLANLGIVSHAQGALDDAAALYDEALGIARRTGNELLLAGVLENAGMVANARGDTDTAAAFYREALELAQRRGNPSAVASALALLADVSRLAGDLDTAMEQLAESLAIFRDLGDRPRIANALYRMGEYARMRGDYKQARAALDESLYIWRDIGHPLGEAGVLLSLGDLDRLTGNTAPALEHLRTALESLHALGNGAGVAEALECIAATVASGANVELAAELLAAAESMRTRMGIAEPPAEARSVDPPALRAQLGYELYERAAARGAALDDDQAVALARAATAP